MNLQYILRDAALQGTAQYGSAYLANFDEILTEELPDDFVSGRLISNDPIETPDALKISLLYNDRCEISFIRKNGIVFSIMGEDMHKRVAPEGIKVTIPKDHPDFNRIARAASEGRMSFGFANASGQKYDQLYSNLHELIFRNRVIIKPDRTLIYHHSVRSDGRNNWSAIPADPSSSMGLWMPGGESPSYSTESITDKAASNSSQKVVASVPGVLSLPFIKNVSLSDYALILDDEDDLLLEFRAAMREYVAIVERGEKSAQEVLDDILYPKVARIERTFKRISQRSRLTKAGAGIATTALTLTAFATHGVAAAIAAAAGGGSTLAFVKEWAGELKEKQGLEDDPVHLLWRMQRAGKPH